MKGNDLKLLIIFLLFGLIYSQNSYSTYKHNHKNHKIKSENDYSDYSNYSESENENDKEKINPILEGENKYSKGELQGLNFSCETVKFSISSDNDKDFTFDSNNNVISYIEAKNANKLLSSSLLLLNDVNSLSCEIKDGVVSMRNEEYYLAGYVKGDTNGTDFDPNDSNKIFINERHIITNIVFKKTKATYFTTSAEPKITVAEKICLFTMIIQPYI